MAKLSATLLCLCKAGSEDHLRRELDALEHGRDEGGSGWILSAAPNQDSAVDLSGLCFAQACLFAPHEISEKSVNAQAAQLCDYFCQSARQQRFDQRWPVVFVTAGVDGLQQRQKKVRDRFVQLMRKRMSRVIGLADFEENLGPGEKSGLFVYFADFDRLIASRHGHFFGQGRMRQDPQAPSRSYLKIEEAYRILGRQPQQGQRVVDLGAAPGGWSYSAAKRGATVLAIDNAALKGAALEHPAIRHLRADAFQYTPTEGKRPTWLLCDMVADPYLVLPMVQRWFSQGWCRYFVVNLKYGHKDPMVLLQKIQDPKEGLALHCDRLSVLQLHHNREEVTACGRVVV